MHIGNTNQAIEAFVAASEELGSDPRHRHILRESLRSLVRQAKAEQLMEVRRDAARVCALAAARQQEVKHDHCK